MHPLRFRAVFKFAVVTAALSLAVLTPARGFAQSGGSRVGIAATVNDDVVTVSDVNNRMKLYLGGMRAQPSPDQLAKMRADILDKLIDEKLELQEAKDLSITVTEQDVKDAFARIAEQNKQDVDTFRKQLQSTGVNPTTLDDQLRADVAWSQVTRRKLRPQINISEAEIDNEIARLKRVQDKPSYHFAEIFLPASADTDAAVKAQADEIMAALTSGTPFPAVAREKSKSPGAAQGGDVGWMNEEQVDPVLANALKQMQPGQLSPPLRTATGYYILYLREKNAPASAADGMPAADPMALPQDAAVGAPATAGATPGAKISMRQLLMQVSAKDPQAVTGGKAERLKTLKDEVKDCAALSSKGASLGQISDLNDVSVAELPEQLQTLVAPLAVGELSQPLRTPDGIAVLMVCSRQDATAAAAPAAPATPASPLTAANPEQSRDAVANKIGMQRLNAMQERYLSDLRATAFIEKRI